MSIRTSVLLPPNFPSAARVLCCLTMGWGWGRYGGYGGYGRAAPKATKASAATLSTATLQRVLAQKAAEEEAAVRYQLQHQQVLAPRPPARPPARPPTHPPARSPARPR